MDLSTAYRYNQNMMEYYTCKYQAFISPNLRSSVPLKFYKIVI